MLIDSHCHLNFKDYPPEELEAVLSRSAENEVSFMITVGAGEGLEGNAKAIALAEKYPQIFATVGIHPHDVRIIDAMSSLPRGIPPTVTPATSEGQERGPITGQPEQGGGQENAIGFPKMDPRSHDLRQAGMTNEGKPAHDRDDGMRTIEQLAQHPKVVAIGEVGLDFFYEHSPREKQEEVLPRFIELARKCGKPLMIHDRGAGERTYEILKSNPPFPPFSKGGGGGFSPTAERVVIHCFTGTKELARKYLDMGCMLSFSGIVTFKKSTDLQEIVKWVPLEKMLVETDSPYLSPEPFRGKTNEPAHVKEVAEKIAALKGVSFEDVARITTLNAKRFFSLPLPELVASVVYSIRDSLYLNITNRCTLACTFCPKFIDFEVKGYYLKLPKEPTVDEVMALSEATLSPLGRGKGEGESYHEVVFCGYGEPTRRLPELIEIAGKLKSRHPSLRIRLNTDGLGNLVYGRNILPEISPYVDALSVSLNAADASTYAKYCPSKYKESAYPAVKDFIREATKHIRDVTATVVGLPDVDREACEKIAVELGAQFRYREYNNVG